jgi:membrane protease YdiL (CAAX protease family)
MNEPVITPPRKQLLLPLLLWLSFILAIVLLVPKAMFAWMPIARHSADGYWAMIAFQWLGLIGIVAFLDKVANRPLVLWPGAERSWQFHVGSLLGLFASFLLAMVAVATFVQYFGLTPNNPLSGVLAAVQGRPFLLLALTFTAGAVEELVTRVYILPHMAGLLKSPRWAIVLSSAIFALAHFDGHDWLRISGPFLLGLILGTHYWRYRSIGAIIAAHFLWDLILLSIVASASR